MKIRILEGGPGEKKRDYFFFLFSNLFFLYQKKLLSIEKGVGSWAFVLGIKK